MATATGQKKKLHTGRHASAIKRARQSEKLRRHNRKSVKEMRAAVKAVRVAVASKDVKGAAEALKIAIPIVAKTAGRGIIPKGRASRYISRMSQAVQKSA